MSKIINQLTEHYIMKTYLHDKNDRQDLSKQGRYFSDSEILQLSIHILKINDTQTYLYKQGKKQFCKVEIHSDGF